MPAKTTPNQAQNISQSEMAQAIARSGYLIEQRIVPILQKAAYTVTMNPVYLDTTTGRSREYDFSALGLDFPFHGFDHMVWTHLHGECINNPQPVVFFSYHDDFPYVHMYDVAQCGIPLRFSTEGGNEGNYHSLPEFLNFNTLHHYCKGIFSTQYCSFVLKKGPQPDWMAWHEEEHHSAIESLIQSVMRDIDNRLSSWRVRSRGEEAYVDLEFFYPVVVLQGDLFECIQVQGKPVFTPREHIQYRKVMVSGSFTDTYQVDIIIEPFFPKYLAIIGGERKAIVNRLRRHKKKVLASVDRITTLVREAKRRRKDKDFRELLTSLR